jgi:hypothetical protein
MIIFARSLGCSGITLRTFIVPFGRGRTVCAAREHGALIDRVRGILAGRSPRYFQDNTQTPHDRNSLHSARSHARGRAFHCWLRGD